MSASLLPINATAQERALDLSAARLGTVPVPIKTLWDPQTCPAGILPWLAWALSVDDWSPEWTEQQKRGAIEASIEVHRRKGTIGALRRALSAIGYEVHIDERTGQPYTFRLQVDVSEMGMSDPAFFDRVEQVALSSKNARSHLLGVDGLLKTSVGLAASTVTTDSESTEILPFVVTLARAVGGSLGAYLSCVETTCVNPAQ